MREKSEYRSNGSVGQLIVILIMGALIGSIIGEIIGEFFPSSGSLMHRIFVSGISPGFRPVPINLYVILLTVGISIKLNLCSAVGIVLAAYIYRFF